MMTNERTTLDSQPVVIIGAPRSGTNMLRDLLGQFDAVATWPCDEINAVWRHLNVCWPSDALPPELATDRVQRYVRTAFNRRARRSAGRFVVEKTCANSLRVDYVDRILPEAKFVFLVRDGRDVVASALRRWRARLEPRYLARKARFVPLTDVPYYASRLVRNRMVRVFSREGRLANWGPRFPGMDRMLATHSLEEVCGEQWRQCVTQAQASLVRLPAGRTTLVRYESFVQRPQEHLIRLLQFLQIPYEPVQAEHAGRQVSGMNVGKDRQRLDPRFLDGFGTIVEETLSVLPTFQKSDDA